MSSLSRVTAGTAIGLLVGVVLYGGCSSNAGNAPEGNAINPGSTGDGGTTSGPTGVDDSGTAITLGDAPPVGEDVPQNFDASDANTCAADEYPVKLTPVNLIFIVDKSGSMGAGGGQSAADDIDKRWNPMVAAFTAFFDSVTSPALQASFTFFPAPCDLDLDAGGGCVCDPNEYNPTTAQANSGSSLPLTQIAGHTKTFTDFLNNNQPNGGTPTIAALQGSYTYATSVQAKSPPGGVTYVVLITDGAPGFGVLQTDGAVVGSQGCPNNTINPPPSPIEQLTQSYADQGIKTYVFGMGNISGLNRVATAGGTSFVTIMVGDAATTTQEFIRSLNEIPKPIFSCNYPIENYQSVDLNAVNVYYKNSQSSDQHLIYYNESCGQSDHTGWYKDMTKTPPEVVLCTATCDALKTDPTSALNLQFGCPIIVINY